MSWLQNLYETYKAHENQVGVIFKKFRDQEYTLLPISHTTQNAHIEVTISEDGELLNATVLNKEEASTLIPCTEKSASRAGSVVAPYPLHDKLSYVAGDYIAHGGTFKHEEPFQVYIEQLEDWADSQYGHSKVRAIYKYLRKRQLIQDLVDRQVLWLDRSNHLIDKWSKEHETQHGVDKPKIFSVVSGEQDAAFVRFNVHVTKQNIPPVWRDHELFDSFIQYYKDKLGDEDVCYVTGQRLPATVRHANKIRHAADKAKLISANDTSGFTFRGRFREATDVANISYEVSQKAHNALKWLIQRQAKVIDERVFLVWSNLHVDAPDPMEDTYDLSFALASSSVQLQEEREPETNQFAATELAKALRGYRNQLPKRARVSVLVLDSATTGRMAVLYYRDLDFHLYVERLIDWHRRCAWRHRSRKKDKEIIEFIGAPSAKDIAFAAYGPSASDKVVKGLMERLLPCIIDARHVPMDIVRSAQYRASNPVAMESWEWERTLSIACSLIHSIEGGYTLALDLENDDRDYLFGRLLAVADVLERTAMGRESNRTTNAIRYMNAFSRHPARTWYIIQHNLQPYLARVKDHAYIWNKRLDEIGSRIKVEDYHDGPLSGKYLLGFYSQRQYIYSGGNKTKAGEPATEYNQGGEDQ